jgi:hypothetical protein
MSRARCTIAARTKPEKLIEVALRAFGVDSVEQESAADFDEVLDFCLPRTEELGGAVGSDAWFCWTHGDWAVLGDLGLLLWQETDALSKISAELGSELVVVATDSAFEFAHFALYDGGKQRRALKLEDEIVEVAGLPVPAERGRPLDDFIEEDADRLWTSYGLPTVELPPEGGPFQCVELNRGE